MPLPCGRRGNRKFKRGKRIEEPNKEHYHRRVKMKNKTFLMCIIGIMLMLGTATVNAQSFQKSFNMDYPVYGIDLMGYTKSLIMRDLTLSDNFISSGNRKVTCEEAAANKDGDEYTIKLLLNTGLTRTARLEINFKSDAVTERNCITFLSLYDFSTRRTERITYGGREQILEQLVTRFVELMDMFYNKDKLLS
jgi:hypothetical protein